MKLSALSTALILTVMLLSCQLEKSYLQRDVRDDVFYFIMPDRFSNGDASNDLGGLGGDKFSHGFDPIDKGFYHGGDMRGLEEKLDYLKGMGITAIWMTPILKNKAVQGDTAGYHGYWTLDFTQIDPHFGGNEDLQSLIDAAHERNMKVFFDIIVNHTADVIKYEECHEPDGSGGNCPYKSLEQVASGDVYTPFIPVGEEQAKIPAWLNDPQYYHNQGDSTFSGENSVYGDFAGLDDLATEQPAVVEGMIDIFKEIVTQFHPDGFRIDTVKHVNIEFWQQFSPAIMAHAKAEGIPNFFMFGEVYDSNPTILSQYTTEGKLPSVLDFGIQNAGSNVFAGNGESTALKDLFNNDDYYSDADSNASNLMNFMGNHDIGRIGMFIQSNQPDADDGEKLARARLANALMFFARGIPVIYYGDEQGFTGDGGDRDARENMFPSQVESYNDNDLIGTDATTAEDNFDTSHPLYQALAELSDVYQHHPALRHGIQAERYSEDNGQLYAFSRFEIRHPLEYLIIFNGGANARTLTLPATAKQYHVIYGNPGAKKIKADQNMNITIDTPGLDVVILKACSRIKKGPKAEFTLAGIADGQIVTGRKEVSLSVPAAEALPVSSYRAEFSVSVDGGEFEFIAEDYTLPYRLMWDTSQYENGSEVKLKVRLGNLKGEVTEKVVSVIVDSRVPEHVRIDYENGNQRRYAFVLNQNGGLQGPFSTDAIDFRWADRDQTNLIIFADINGDGAQAEVVVDKPLLLERAEVIALSTEAEDGNLEADLFLNHLGELSNTDNDSGGLPDQLPQDAATAPLGEDVNLRGSLNEWGADPMSYIGNNTYHLVKEVMQGDAEFKFADADWSYLNIGAPVTATGLSHSSNPGNLLHNFSAAGVYNLYLISSALDGVEYNLYLLMQ